MALAGTAGRKVMHRLDLHIHSCLSPCGSLEMSPAAIVAAVQAAGLTGFALCDHNSAKNCVSVARLAKNAGLFFLPGIEVCTMEEAHLLSLFVNVDDALSFSSWLETKLPDMPNIPEKLGDQVVVNEFDEIEDEVTTYLGQSVMVSINEVVAEVHARGGLVIPAHIDKPVFSVVSQLGFLDVNTYDAVELSSHAAVNPAFDRGICMHYPVVTGSDAHYLPDIGKVWIEVDIAGETIAALKDGLAGAVIKGRA